MNDKKINYLDIKMMGNDGNLYSINSFRNKKVILYFYPKDNTPGCSYQSKKYSENLEMLEEKYNAIVVGCSLGSAECKQNFKDKKGLNQLLLSCDGEEGAVVAEALGALTDGFMKKKTIHRTTIIFNEAKAIIYQMFNVKFRKDLVEVTAFLDTYQEKMDEPAPVEEI